MILHRVIHYDIGVGSINFSCEKGLDNDSYTAEKDQHENEHFGDRCRNMKEDNTFSIVYRNINTLTTYNNNQK